MLLWKSVLSSIKHDVGFSGHDLEEIRTRALSAIVSKLDYGLVTVEELIDKDNLFENLIESLQKANRNSKEEILKLILRLIKVRVTNEIIRYASKILWFKKNL